jgi:hypothetical protein
MRVADWYAKVKTVKSETGNRLNQYWEPKSCFFTSACVETLGLPDDCDILLALGDFRDSYVATMPDGAQIIENYYAIAPSIVRAIDRSENALEVYVHIHATAVECVDAIQRDAPQGAIARYLDIFQELTQTFLVPAANGVLA